MIGGLLARVRVHSPFHVQIQGCLPNGIPILRCGNAYKPAGSGSHGIRCGRLVSS
jgi:hypothetical protein